MLSRSKMQMFDEVEDGQQNPVASLVDGDSVGQNPQKNSEGMSVRITQRKRVRERV